MMLAQRATGRRGLTLLEVLVALTVFLFSYAALWQLMNTAGDAAIALSYRNQATRLAQSKLAEIAAGVEALQSTGATSFDDPDGDYSWSADVQPGLVDSLSTVTVTVTRLNKDGSELKIPITQMVLNPANRGSTQDVTGTPLTGQAASSSTTDSSSGSSTGK